MKTETLYISKETDTYSTDEVKLCFINSENIEEIKAYVEKADERLFVSWASVDGYDNDREKIPIDLVIKAQDELMKRGAPIMYRHTNKNIGKTLAYKVAQHPKTNKLGVLHLNKVYNSLPIDDEVWQDIKTGKLKGLSVGGQGVIGSKEYDDETGSMIDIYSKFGQYETSVAQNPSNPLAINEAFSCVAKEKQMGEEKQIQEIVKELSDVVTSLKKEVETIKSDFADIKKEEKTEENVEDKTEEVKTEDKEESSEPDKTPKEAEVGEATEPAEAPAEAGVEKEADLKTQVESIAKEVKAISEKINDLTKEESVDKEETETVTMEAPATEVKKEEQTKDISKEYNEAMKEFEQGKVSYEEVMNKFRK